MKKIIENIKNKAVLVKDNLLLIGSGITAVGVLFVIASVFIDALGLYVGLIVGILIVTEVMNLINGNKKEVK